MNRLVSFILFLIFFSLDAVSQISHDINTDTVVSSKELHFQDSIAKLNTVNRNLKNSRDAFNKGISFFESILYKKAVEAYTEAISLDSLFIDAYYNRAKAYQLDLDTMLALKDCNRLLTIDSTYLDALYLYAELYKNIDRQESFLSYEKILKLDPNQYPALYEQGVLYFIDDEIEQAIRKFTQALSIKIDARALNDRGSCYRIRGQYEESISDYNAAISADPSMLFIYNNLASVYRKKGDMDKAILNYTLAIEKNPDFSMAYNNRGSIYLANNQMVKALEDFNKALSINSNYSLALNNRGILFYKQDKYQQAIADFDMAIVSANGYGKAYLNRGIAKQMIRDEEGACADWYKAKDLGIKIAEKYISNDCE